MVIAYTDGSAHPNPGKGGFGVVFVDENGNVLEEYSKSCEYTTNNTEELKAIVFAASYAALRGEAANIYSDSAYAINCLSTWMYSWKDNGWTKSNGDAISNLDLIKAYYYLVEELGISIMLHKVKGHNGNIYNEMADSLATKV